MRLSRRKIAEYAADALMAGKSTATVLKQVAAYLYESRRTAEVDLVVRDIEQALADRGVVVADVTTAHPLSKEAKMHIASLVKSSRVQLRETIDESVLGGVRVQLPGKRFDGTIRHKLTLLKAKQL